MTDAEHPDTSRHPDTSSGTPYLPEPESASDAELIRLVRAGDSQAYEQLFLRHREVAIRYARRIADSERAEDLCAEAFTKIFDLLQRGKGPEVAFRAYLLTTVRTSHLNAIRAGSREDLVADHESLRRMRPHVDDPDARFDAGAIFRAFDKLPERWQAALWLTTVEGLTNEEASKHLGVKVNAVASLAFRARSGLRQAYLSEHLLETTDPQCRRIVTYLPSYLRDGLTPRRRAAVELHLSTCTSCATAALELSEVNTRLGAVLAPLALTGVAVGGAAVIVPAKATSLVAIGLASLSTTGSSAATAAKSFVSTTVLHAKAGGAALSGMAGAKLAAAATVTALGVAVGSEVLHPDSSTPASTGRAERATVVDEPVRTTPQASPAQRRTAAALPAPFRPTAGPTPGPSPSASPGPTPPNRAPAAPVPTPAAAPSASAPAGATPAPTTSATPSPGTTSPRMGIGQPTTQTSTRSGLLWDQVTLPVTGATRNSTLVLTTTRTFSAALATTTGTGWICGTPVVSWFDGGFHATSRITCMFTGNAAPGPLRFDYQVVAGSVFTAALTPPAGVLDSDPTDNLRRLLLR